MYSELVKKLRNRRVCIQSGGDLERDFPVMREAADAIEYLMRKLESRESALTSVVERLGDSTVAAADVLDTTEDRIG